MGVVILPKSLTPKTEIKSGDLMANFNAITAQVNGKLDQENFAESLRNALIPAGTLLATARAAAPAGFLLCQGQAVSRTTYAVLFAAMGTTFGAGDGTTTFNLPDGRGSTFVGADAGALRLDGAWAPRNLGQRGGSMWLAQHVHGVNLNTGAESALHNHFLGWSGITRHEGSGFAYADIENTGLLNFTSTEQQSHGHAVIGNTAVEGLGNGQNMPPYQIIQWMIKI